MVIPSPRALGSMLIYWRVDVPNYPHFWKPPRAMGIDAWNFQQENHGMVVVIGDDKSHCFTNITVIKLQMTALFDTCSICMYLWEPLRF